MKFDKYLIILLLVAAVYTYLVMDLISGFKELPSPLYGGDYYYQLGAVYHIYESPVTEWFSSTNIPGGMPGYLPLYGILVTVFGKSFGLDPMHAMFYSNLLWPLISLLAFFFLLIRITKDPEISLLGTVFLVGIITVFPIFKYTDFTQVIIVPLFFLSLFNFFEKQSNNNSLMLGIAYGTMGLAHGTSFLLASFLIPVTFVYIIYSKKDSGFAAAAKELWLPFTIAFGLGFLVSQLLWFTPIFIQHGQTKLGNTIFAFPDTARPDVMFQVLFDGLQQMFFNTRSLLLLAVSLLSLAGTYHILRFGRETEHSFLKLAFVSTFIFAYSYFLTSPILDTHMIPSYVQNIYLTPLAIMLGLVFLRDYTKGKEDLRKTALIIFLVLFILNLVSGYSEWYDNQWRQTGRNLLPLPILSLQSYLLANTSIDDVILSNNELSFAFNAISGRKAVISRRSQNDPFLEFDSRELDAAVILYGNNTSRKLSLMKKYNISYIYHDLSWPSMEYSFIKENDSYRIVGYFDPILVIFSKERENALIENGIAYRRINGFIDPSIRTPDIRTFDLLMVTADNYDTSGKGFWKDDIDPYLNEVWKYEENGEAMAALYKLKAQ